MESERGVFEDENRFADYEGMHEGTYQRRFGKGGYSRNKREMLRE